MKRKWFWTERWKSNWHILIDNRVRFKEMFNNKSAHPSAHSIYKSERLDWE